MAPGLGLGSHRQAKSRRELLLSSLVSAVLVLFTHFALSMVPHFLSSSLSLFAMLPVSGSVMLVALVLGRWWKRLVGVAACAPAAVLVNILFLWGVYIVVIRTAIRPLLDTLFHIEFSLLICGLYSILSRDPGLVKTSVYSDPQLHPEEVELSTIESLGSSHMNTPFPPRVRHCSSCKASVRGFDHHCPAFGNCIGQKNHLLFLTLLVGFIIAEASYTMSSTHYITIFLNMSGSKPQSNRAGSLVISTTLFCLLQMLWQVVFLMWHVYCVCFNIRTDEWINWRKYPEFQHIQQQPGPPSSEMMFRNPYDKGIIGNITDFLRSR